MAAEMFRLQAANASMKANLQEAKAEIGKQKHDALQAPKQENGHKKKNLPFLELGVGVLFFSWIWINEYVESLFWIWADPGFLRWMPFDWILIFAVGRFFQTHFYFKANAILEEAETKISKRSQDQQKLQHELQRCKDQIKHLKDTLQQRSGSVEVQKMQKELEDLTQEHQQTKAMLVESEKRKSDIQSEIARVQSAKTSLEDELSKQQEETAGLKAKLEAKADHSMKTSQDWMFEHFTAVFFSEKRYLQLAFISRCVKSLPSGFFHFRFNAVLF